MNRLDPLMERTLADIPLNEIAGIRMPKIHEQELGLKLKLFTTGIAGAFCPCLVLHTKKGIPGNAFLVLNYQLREPLHLEQVPYTTTSQLEA